MRRINEHRISDELSADNYKGLIELVQEIDAVMEKMIKGDEVLIRKFSELDYKLSLFVRENPRFSYEKVFPKEYHWFVSSLWVKYIPCVTKEKRKISGDKAYLIRYL